MRLQLADGASLSYECAGDPAHPCVLLWHGAQCTLRQWDTVVPQLQDAFYVVRFDVRGAGQSTGADPANYRFETYAADACTLLDHLHVQCCHVWGMAWGSRAALLFCAMHPERTISAALFDLSIGTADPHAQQEGARAARAKLRAKGYEPPPLPEGWNTHEDDKTLALSLAAAAQVDLAEFSPRLTMPVLVATGDHDPNLRSSRDAVGLMPQASLVELTDIGHGSVLMHPDLCLATWRQFVRDLGA